MRITWILPGVMALLLSARAADIAAYLAPSAGACPYQAKKMASDIFESAGVTLEWRSPREVRVNPPRIWLRIELVQDTPQQRLPGALAVSYPFDRCTKVITVFLDRIRSLTRDFCRESQLLAYVLVHEITHVIEGSGIHTAEGIMKTRWSTADRAAMYRKSLSFLPEDLQRIRQGLVVEWCQSHVSLNGQSLSETAAHPE